MNTIGREELRARINRGDDFKLVMVQLARAYRAVRIPGSINLSDPRRVGELLDPDDDIVVYCTNANCAASRYVYRLLVASGYRRVRRYSGGLEDWTAAGYPLEGAGLGGGRRPLADAA